MDVRLVVLDGGPSDPASLLRSLLEEPAVRRYGDARLVAGDRDSGHMGSAWDVVAVVIGLGLAAAQLVVAVAQWRESRPSRPRVTIEWADGTVTISGDDPETIARLVRALED